MSQASTPVATAREVFFDTSHLHADLKGRSVRGGAATLVGQGVKFAVRTASTVVLARLLTPADYGLIAMVTAVTGFAALFKDLGLSMATVQKAEVTHEQVSVLFWVNVAISVLVAAITAALAPAIAWFYGEPRLTAIGMVLSLAFVFSGLTVQHQALLRRQMRFGILAAIPIISMSVAVMAAIISGVLGAGYWALVIMEVARAGANAVAVWLACRWRPGLPRRGAGVRGMLRFGANLTGFSALNYFARNLDNILIGRVWGPGPLGFYSKAYGLLMLPIGQVTAPIAAVAVPALSRLQDDPEQYRRYFYRAINFIALLTMPLIFVLAALSDEVILLVLGEQWTGVARIFKVLAFAAVLQPVTNPTGWVYVSLGQTNRMMRWAFIMVPLTVISFVVGLPWGAFGVAVSYTVCSVVILAIPSLWWAFRGSPLTIASWIGAIHRPLVVSVMLYCAIEVVGLLGYENPLVRFAMAMGAVVALLTITLVFWRGMRKEVFDSVRLLRILRR